jgi:hypothetical protein
LCERFTIRLMNRYVVAAAAVALPLVVVAVAMGLRGGEVKTSSTGSSPSVPVGTVSLQTEPTTTGPAATEPAPSTPNAPLEDGRHFGYIKRVDFQTSTVVFDLAYLLKGEKANEAAAAHGYETPVDNDYFIVNDNPRLRTLTMSPHVQVLLLNWNRCCNTFFQANRRHFEASFRIKHFTGGNYQGTYGSYWLTVQDGAVVKIQNQYQP